MTNFALDENYFLLRNQPRARAKICAFVLLQRTHRPQNAPQRFFSRDSSPRQNLARPPPGERFMGLRTSTTYESTQRMLTDNANMYGERVRGSIRRGEALLTGLLRCGECGRKLHAEYGGNRGIIGRYECRGELGAQANTRC